MKCVACADEISEDTNQANDGLCDDCMAELEDRWYNFIHGYDCIETDEDF